MEVHYIDGKTVPVDLEGVSSLSEVRLRVAKVMGAPSPQNVELLDESGERLVEEFINERILGEDKIIELPLPGDMMKIQAFLFGLGGEEEAESDAEQDFSMGTINEEEDGCHSAPDGYQHDAPILLAAEVKQDIASVCLSKLGDYKRGEQAAVNGGGSLNLMSGEETADDAATRASSEQADSPSRSFPLHESVNLGDCDAVTQLLADGEDVGKRDANGDTALHRAAYHSRKDIVDVLLAARADPNSTDRKGKTPLRRAYDSKDVAAALLSGGADPNAADKSGNTSLHRAAEDGHLEVGKLLLGASADPNIFNEEDLTALHTAAMCGNADIASELLAARADIHARGTAGNTALHFAAYSGHQTVGEFLLQSGADAKLLNDDDETPLQHAKTADRHDLAWLVA